MISKEKIAEIKEALEADKKRIEEKLVSIKDIDFGDTPGNDNEEADESEEFQNKMGTVESLEDMVETINGALQRIEDGSYGICIRCEKEISGEMLEANPESALCKGCKVK